MVLEILKRQGTFTETSEGSTFQDGTSTISLDLGDSEGGKSCVSDIGSNRMFPHRFLVQQ